MFVGKLQDAERAGKNHEEWLTAPRYLREILKCPEFEAHWNILTTYGEFKITKPTQDQNREIVAKFLEEEMIKTQRDKDRQQDLNAWQKADSHANSVHANLARSVIPPKTSLDCAKFYYRGQCAAGNNCPNKHDNSRFPDEPRVEKVLKVAKEKRKVIVKEKAKVKKKEKAKARQRPSGARFAIK